MRCSFILVRRRHGRSRNRRLRTAFPGGLSRRVFGPDLEPGVRHPATPATTRRIRARTRARVPYLPTARRSVTCEFPRSTSLVPDSFTNTQRRWNERGERRGTGRAWKPASVGDGLLAALGGGGRCLLGRGQVDRLGLHGGDEVVDRALDQQLAAQQVGATGAHTCAIASSTSWPVCWACSATSRRRSSLGHLDAGHPRPARAARARAAGRRARSRPAP